MSTLVLPLSVSLSPLLHVAVMAPAAPTGAAGLSSSKATLSWRPTKIMNMRDLAKDDDFLSHLLVEKLGTGTVPLLVHKMDPSRRLPKTDAQDLLAIVRRVRSPVHCSSGTCTQMTRDICISPAGRLKVSHTACCSSSCR